MSTNGNGMTHPTILLSGPTKIGKTVSVIRATGPSAFWLCTERGALVPAIDPELNPYGVIPSYIECLDPEKPWEEAMAAVRAAIKTNKFGAIVVDTLSSLADREFVRIRVKDHVKEDFGRANKLLADRIKSLVWEVIDSGLVFIATAHEREPTTIEGRFTPGGPKLPGRLVEDVPSLFSIVLRCDTAAGSDGRPKRVFRCDPLDRSYLTGDRYNVVTDGMDMDLKLVLRSAVEKARAFGGSK